MSSHIKASLITGRGSLGDIGKIITLGLEVEAEVEALKGAPVGEPQPIPPIKTRLVGRHAEIDMTVTFKD